MKVQKKAKLAPQKTGENPDVSWRILFDPEHYLKANPDVAESPFVANPEEHFLVHGNAEFRSFNAMIDSKLLESGMREIDRQVCFISDYLDDPRFWCVRPNLLFLPTFYFEQLNEQPSANPLVHYANIGWKRRCRPHPLFDPDYCLRQLGVKWTHLDIAPLERFLRAADHTVSPHPLFDVFFFSRHYGSRDEHPMLNYLRFGIDEEASPSPLIDPGYLRQLYPFMSPPERIFKAAVLWQRFAARPALAGLNPISRRVRERRWKKFLLEKHRLYEVCCLLPFLKRGGGELAASYYVKAAAELFGADRILIILTDEADLAASAWFPPGIRIIALDEADERLLPEERRVLLEDIISYLRPRRLHIMNSDVGWQGLTVRGGTWSKSIQLIGNFYAFQYDDHGEQVGFIASYFENNLPHLDAVFHDNKRVKDDLKKNYNLTSHEAEKLTVAYNPVRQNPKTKRSKRDAADVLWAGRLDDEKLPEVLAAVARALPDIQFHVWGARTVDRGEAGGRLDALANVRLMGVYETFDEIVENYEYRCFLFTSKWEGMPNVLLEAVNAKIPIVAAAVGGVPEIVIGGETGYLVSEPRDVAAYVAQVQSLFEDNEEAGRRAKKAFELLVTQHSWPKFRETVWGVYRKRQSAAENTAAELLSIEMLS